MIARFLIRCALLGLPAVGIVSGYIATKARYFPAPRITNNLALNEKLAFTKEDFSGGADVIAIGSSMALNNLSSSEVMGHFGNVRYVNTGAWGMGALEWAMLGPTMADRLKPNTVIVASNLMDFRKADPGLAGDSLGIAKYLDATCELWSYLRHWDAPYYLRQMESNRIRFTDPANYEYLAVDAHGGATLVVPKDRIIMERFNALPPEEAELDEERYAAFNRFARDLEERGIRLVLMQCAYRSGVRTTVGDALQEKHVARLRALLEPMGHLVVDANTRKWPDDLYVDSSHLGQEGAEAMTKYCLDQLSELH